MKQTDAYVRVAGSRGLKRTWNDDSLAGEKAARSANSAASVLASFELHDCAQVCRAFTRGRCLKSNDPNDLTRCREYHDKPKGEVKCCSIFDPADPLYNKNFAYCRAKMAGEECQYICSAQDGMGVTPMVTAASGAAAPTQDTQPGASGGLTETDGPAGAHASIDEAFNACCGHATGDDPAAGGGNA